MGQQTKKTTNKRGLAAPCYSSRLHDTDDATDLELLGLWILISRLRETLHDNRRRRIHKAAGPRTLRHSTVRREHVRHAIRRQSRPTSSSD